MADADEALPGVGVRRFKAVHRKGSLIELEDESRWEVLPGQEMFTNHWVPDTEITVVPGGYRGYPYDLINAKSGDRVPARFKGPHHGWTLIDH